MCRSPGPVSALTAAWPACPSILPRPMGRNIWEVLARCSELGAPNTDQLDEARTRFIDNHLLPALNRRGAGGWWV